MSFTKLIPLIVLLKILVGGWFLGGAPRADAPTAGPDTVLVKSAEEDQNCTCGHSPVGGVDPNGGS